LAQRRLDEAKIATIKALVEQLTITAPIASQVSNRDRSKRLSWASAPSAASARF
jgi:hypothetical protein